MSPEESAIRERIVKTCLLVPVQQVDIYSQQREDIRALLRIIDELREETPKEAA